jgi:ADP-ribosylglycohydrolase
MTEWVFVGPNAVLNDRSGKQIGKYYGPPATWEAMDGSKITGAQLAVAPAGAGNIPYQLVKANPAMGMGAMTGVTHIQRVALKGGVAPATACSLANKGAKETVKYQADYIFWKAA